MIPAAIEDMELREHIASLPADGREVFLIADDTVRISSVSATAMVNQMRVNHRTGLMETYILGQAYIAGALLTSTVKGNDRIRMDIECGGPVKGLSVEAWASGAVRGYLYRNPIPLDSPLESLDTSPMFGPGFLTVTRILEGSRIPFSGQVMLGHGSIAKDLALYFQESEQTPSLFYLSISFDKAGRVWGAGGIFIQAMPGADEGTLSSLQEEAGKLKGMGKALSCGMTAREYAEQAFSAYSPRHAGHTPVGFSCPCSREGFREYLGSLPEAERKGIEEGSFPLVLECFNCGSEYGFGKEEIESIFREER